MRTCPCNVEPLTPQHLHSKTGVYRGIHYFLIFALNIDFWYSLAGLTCTHNLCFSKNKKNVKIFRLKIVIFNSFKNRCILHRRVIVMCFIHMYILIVTKQGKIFLLIT